MHQHVATADNFSNTMNTLTGLWSHATNSQALLDKALKGESFYSTSSDPGHVMQQKILMLLFSR